MYRSRNGGNGEVEIILSHCLLGYNTIVVGIRYDNDDL